MTKTTRDAPTHCNQSAPEGKDTQDTGTASPSAETPSYPLVGSQVIMDHAGAVKALADIVQNNGLTQLEYRYGGVEIKLARSAGPGVAGDSVLVAASGALTPGTSLAQASSVLYTPVASASGIPTASAASSLPMSGTLVKAPLVGMAYLAPSPEAPPYVKVGDTVQKGDTLLIIEAMKVMNTICAPVSGRIQAIHVSNSSPVEYDEVLMVIDA